MSSHVARLVLASRSPRRRELLTLIGLPFDVTEAPVDEDAAPGETASDIVVRLSHAKASAAVRSILDAQGDKPNTMIIACDTVVTIEGDSLGKPRDANEAIAMLRRLRGRDHEVHSAVVLLDSASDHTETRVACTTVTMRAYADAEIAAYIATGDPFDKAGAYAIQNADFQLVAAWRGCYANVMGLPLCHLASCLRVWGCKPLPGLPIRCQTHTGQRCTAYQDILR